MRFEGQRVLLGVCCSACMYAGHASIAHHLAILNDLLLFYDDYWLKKAAELALKKLKRMLKKTFIAWLEQLKKRMA